MKIYTRTGDRGKTGLVGGERRFKNDARIEAYGAIDEAGAFIGFAISQLSRERDRDIVDVLLNAQQTLWDVGADLATPPAKDCVYRTPETAAGELEPQIDQYKTQAPAVKRFILRGGHPAAAALHVACTIVRRAERRMVCLMQGEEIHLPALKYVNRLSDLLFVLARAVNAQAGEADILYERSPVVFR